MMIELALGIPVVAMIAMMALARLERSLDQATVRPEPAKAVHHARATGTIRVRRSGQAWVLGAGGRNGQVRAGQVGAGQIAVGDVGVGDVAGDVAGDVGVRAVRGADRPPSGEKAGLLGR